MYPLGCSAEESDIFERYAALKGRVSFGDSLTIALVDGSREQGGRGFQSQDVIPFFCDVKGGKNLNSSSLSAIGVPLLSVLASLRC